MKDRLCSHHVTKNVTKNRLRTLWGINVGLNTQSHVSLPGLFKKKYNIISETLSNQELYHFPTLHFSNVLLKKNVHVTYIPISSMLIWCNKFLEQTAQMQLTFLLGYFFFYHMTVSHHDLPSVEFCSTLNVVFSGLLKCLNMLNIDRLDRLNPKNITMEFLWVLSLIITRGRKIIRRPNHTFFSLN